MADVIRRQIELELSATGARVTAQHVAKIEQRTRAAIAANKNLKNDYSALQKIVSRYSKEAVKNARAAAGATKLQRQAIVGLSKAYGGLDKTVQGALKGIIGFASFGGMIAAIKSSMGGLKQYSNAMVSASAIGAKYGIGIKRLESDLIGLSNSLSLTRSETIDLFKSYEQGFAAFSMGGFEKVLANIQKVTGANAKAMQEQMQTLGGLIEKYPDLQNAVERANAGDRRLLDTMTSRLTMTGAMSLAEYKRLQQYIVGNKQMSAADEEAMKNKKDAQKTFQTFAQHAERIGLMLAEAFMPVMKEVADWLNDNKPAIKDFFKSMASGVKSAVSFVKGLVDSLGGVSSALKLIFAIWAGGKLASMAMGGVAMVRSAGAMLGGAGTGAAGVKGAGAMGLGGRFMRGGAYAGMGYLGGQVGQMGKGYFGGRAQQQRDAGDVSGAGRSSAFSGLSGVGGSALSGAGYGAAIGSIIPGIGTAVGGITGGIIGGVIGIVSEWETLSKGFAAWFGSVKGESDERKQELEKQKKKTKANTAAFLKNLKAGRSGLSEEEYEEKQQSEIAKKEMKKYLSGPMTAETRYKIREDFKKSSATLKSEKERVGKSRGAAFAGGGEYGVGKFTASDADTKQIASDLAALYAQVDKVLSDDVVSANLVSGLENKITIYEDIADSQKEIRKEGDKDVAKAEADHQRKLAAKQAMVVSTVRERMIIESINGLYEARGAKFDALIKKAQVFGATDMGGVKAAAAAQAEVADAEIEQIKNYLSMLREKKPGEKESVGNQKLRNSKLKEMGLEWMSQLKIAEQMEQMESKLIEKETARETIANNIVKARQGELELLSANTNMATTLVSIADNYAMGVGASAEMRMRAVGAVRAEVEILKQQEADQAAVVADQEARGKKTIKSKTILRNIQNDILKKVQQEAQIARSLRDGWISAISAMNTGSGRFTKIMISQQQNMAAGLNTLGMIKSAMSGATASEGGGFGGRVGYGGGAMFGAQQGVITSQYGPGGTSARSGGLPYSTGRAGDDAGSRAVRQGRSEAARTLRRMTEKKSDIARRGGGLLPSVFTGAQESGKAPFINRFSGANVFSGIPNLPGISRGIQASAVPGSGAKGGAVAYTIPAVNISVTFDNFDHVKELLSNAIYNQFAALIDGDSPNSNQLGVAG